MNTPQFLIIHHGGGTDASPLADTSNQKFEVIDQYHKEKFNMKSSLGYYCGYHYFIDKTGKLTQARADTDEGAHTVGYNKKSLGICLAGNFDATMPSKAQIDTLRALLLRLMKLHGIKAENVVPHRTFAKKTCYGNNLPDNWARSLVEETNELKKFSTLQLMQELQRRIIEKDL